MGISGFGPGNVAILDSESSGSTSGSSSSGSSVLRASLGVRAALARGSRSTCLQVVGDSTGDEADEWFAVLAAKAATKFPAFSVVTKSWNETTNAYDGSVAISAGTGNGGGTRGVTLAASSNMKYTNTTTTLSDITVTVRLSPAAGWAPGGAAASRTIVSRYQASGSNRCWWFYLDESGNLKFTWSAAGTADTGTKTSSAAVPFAGSDAGWVRVYFDVDDGASGNAATFSTSTDGTTWTTLGAVQTDATATSLSAYTGDYYLGSRNTTPSDYGPGTYYNVQVRGGSPAVGTPLVPFYPELWIESAGTRTLAGAPRLTFLNSSVSGKNVAYFSGLSGSGWSADAARPARVFEDFGQHLIIISTCHNDGTDGGSSWRKTYGDFLIFVKGKRTNVPLLCLGQNPTLASVDTWKTREERGATLLSVAEANGCFGLDVYPQFSTDQAVLGGGVGGQLEDTIHPSTIGSEIWASYVGAQLGLAD